GLSVVRIVNVAGRRRLVLVRALPFFFEEEGELAPWLLGSLGLFLTALVVALLWSMERRSAAIERIVDERTAALTRQEETLRCITEQMAEGVVVADPGGRFVLFNPAAERLLGAGAMQVDPKAWSDAYRLFRADGKTPYPADELPLAIALRGGSADEVDVL